MNERITELLEVLCHMWDHYCNGSEFDGPVERCKIVLNKYELLIFTEDGNADVNWEMLEKIKEGN
jgi:hypothetical protein